MDNGTIITALIGGIAGLVTIFFGRPYWLMLRTLTNNLQDEVRRLQVRIDDQQKKIDSLENRLYDSELEKDRLSTRLEDYVAKSQELYNNLQRIRTERNEWKNRAEIAEGKVGTMQSYIDSLGGS